MTQNTLPQGMALTRLEPIFREDPYPELWTESRKGNPGALMREYLGRDLTEDVEPAYPDFITE